MNAWFKKRRVPCTPFSEMVYSLLSGKSTIEQCAEMLRHYERKWDVEHVVPELGLCYEDFATRAPARFAHLDALPVDESSWEHFVRQSYYGFLSDTHLVLCTHNYYYDIVFSNRYSFQATYRAWGEMYAEWANRTAWLGRRKWDYRAFSFYSHEYVEDGEAWEEAAYKVIEFKTQQADAEPSAAGKPPGSPLFSDD